MLYDLDAQTLSAKLSDVLSDKNSCPLGSTSAMWRSRISHGVELSEYLLPTATEVSYTNTRACEGMTEGLVEGLAEGLASPNMEQHVINPAQAARIAARRRFKQARAERAETPPFEQYSRIGLNHNARTFLDYAIEEAL
jgi:hypothetical protein